MKRERCNDEIIKIMPEEIIGKILIFFLFFSITAYYFIMIFMNYFFILTNFYHWVLTDSQIGIFNGSIWFINYLIFFLIADILILTSTVLLEIFSRNKKRNIIIYSIFLLLSLSPIILLTIYCTLYHWGCKF